MQATRPRTLLSVPEIWCVLLERHSAVGVVLTKFRTPIKPGVNRVQLALRRLVVQNVCVSLERTVFQIYL